MVKGSRRRGAVFGLTDLSLKERQREYSRRAYERHKEEITARSAERVRSLRRRGAVVHPLAAPRGIRDWLKRLSRFDRGDVAKALVSESRREALRLHDLWLESLDELEEEIS